ncbi:MAG: AAA family ATPase [Bacteroidia bacterium]
MAKKQVKVPAQKLAKKPASKFSSNNHINRLEIKNFKSIKNMKINPKKINIFIGKPNVGKSNVLEAISLLAGYYSTKIHSNGTQASDKYLSDFIRYENFDELYYDGFTGNPIEIISDLCYATIICQYNPGYHHYLIADSTDVLSFIKDEKGGNSIKNAFEDYLNTWANNSKPLRITNSYQLIYPQGNVERQDVPLSVNNPVKKFEFKKAASFPNPYHFYLLPPHGNNLYTIVKHNKVLQKEIAAIFKEYKLDFVMKSKERVFEIQKKIKNIVTSFPYVGVADTLQRYIFHLAAIQSNKDSVLLFEEPEAHNFPAYIRQFAEDVLADENNNQYFITTHSPFILNIILEKAKREDVAVFKLDYKNYQTTAEALSEKEIDDYLSYGTDIFFQLLK